MGFSKKGCSVLLRDMINGCSDVEVPDDISGSFYGAVNGNHVFNLVVSFL